MQSNEKKLKEYESLLIEISHYDDYIKSKLEELNILFLDKMKSTNSGDMRITNVVHENKIL